MNGKILIVTTAVGTFQVGSPVDGLVVVEEPTKSRRQSVKDACVRRAGTIVTIGVNNSMRGPFAFLLKLDADGSEEWFDEVRPRE